MHVVSGAVWLLGQLEKIETEIWAAIGVAVAASIAVTIWILRREFRRNTLVYFNAEAASEIAAEKRAALAPRQPPVVHPLPPA